MLWIETADNKNNVATIHLQIFLGTNIFGQPVDDEIGWEEITNAKDFEQILHGDKENKKYTVQNLDE